MADESKSSGSSTGSTTQTDSTGTGAGKTSSESKPQFVTAEQFQQYQTELQKRLDGQSGTIGKLSDNLKPLLEALTPKKEEKTQEKTQSDTLTARVKAIEDREKTVKDRERLTQVRDALKVQGVPPARALREANLLIMERGEQIHVGDDYSVTFVEGENRTGIADWITAYLKTDEGKLINPEPAPIVPTARGLTGGSAKSGGAHPGAKMTFVDLIKNPEIYSSFSQEHPEQFEEKRKEYYKNK